MAISTCSLLDDIAVVAAFIPRITSQFRIVAPTPKELAVHAWDSSWDALLLSALCHTEIGFNLQSDVPAVGNVLGVSFVQQIYICTELLTEILIKLHVMKTNGSVPISKTQDNFWKTNVFKQPFIAWHRIGGIQCPE